VGRGGWEERGCEWRRGVSGDGGVGVGLEEGGVGRRQEPTGNDMPTLPIIAVGSCLHPPPITPHSLTACVTWLDIDLCMS
jgi:hypothetical protein